MRSLLVGMSLTLVDVFDVPVFWPILMLYFLALFCVTMKSRIKHMIKYKYLPFSTGKKVCGGGGARAAAAAKKAAVAAAVAVAADRGKAGAPLVKAPPLLRPPSLPPPLPLPPQVASAV